MKLIYLSNSIIPSRQANSIHVMKMAQAFSDNGLNTILISIDSESKVKLYNDDYAFYGIKNNFKIIKLPWMRKIGSITYSILSLLKVINIKPDYVYGRCLVAIYFSALFGFKVMYEAHAPFYNQNIFKKFIFNKLLKHKNFIGLVVISEALKNIFLKTESIVKKKILVAHDGADIVDLDAKIELTTTSRLQVGYVGHLYKGRGIDIIMKLSTKLQDIDFHIIGGNEEDIQYWKSQAQNNNIIFHGHLAPSEVYKYRNSFDMLLAPYQNVVSIEGKNDTSKFMSPLKIFEYMSSKKAIISSDLPVLREVLNENNAILVQCDNYDAWIEAIQNLRNKKTRESLAKVSYTDFQLKYTWKIRAQNIFKRFEDV